MYCSDLDAIVCYACMCMDVCVVFYELRPVGEIHMVNQEEEEEGHRRIKLTEGSVCKASIAWDILVTYSHLNT